MGMATSDYDYELPSDRIAGHPAEPRDASRMMVLHRESQEIEHRGFRDIVEYLVPGDALVLNATRVFKARLLGRRDSGAPAEVLLLRARGEGRFEAMVRPGGKLGPGRRVTISDSLRVVIEEVTERRTRMVRLESPLSVWDAIEQHGHVPLPPYISRGDEPLDVERYQTVYAREPGSAAAPTAGLHFTPQLLEEIGARGVEIRHLVLHVGAGTFKPVEVEDPSMHVMHEEWYSIDGDTARALNAVRERDRRIWAVGTTVLRALESNVRAHGELAPAAGDTALFVRPPFEFMVAGGLLTNFHLPRSTLLMLVAAFAGYDLAMHGYAAAIEEGYRFYSYGDAMLIV